MCPCCPVQPHCQPADNTGQAGICKEEAGRSHRRKLTVFGKGTFAPGGRFLPRRAGAWIPIATLSLDLTAPVKTSPAASPPPCPSRALIPPLRPPSMPPGFGHTRGFHEQPWAVLAVAEGLPGPHWPPWSRRTHFPGVLPVWSTGRSWEKTCLFCEHLVARELGEVQELQVQGPELRQDAAAACHGPAPAPDGAAVKTQKHLSAPCLWAGSPAESDRDCLRGDGLLVPGHLISGAPPQG